MHYSMFLVGLLATIANAKHHRLCACQIVSNSGIDKDATEKVVTDANGYIIYSNYEWKTSDGAHFVGSYFHSIDGTQHYAKGYANGNGWLDGKTVYDLCRNAGAADSTCFDNNDYQRCGDGQDGCFNAYDSTDGNGKIISG